MLTAQYWGARDTGSLKKVVSIMLWIVLAIALGFVVATALWPARIMGIYTNDGAVIDKGILYLQVSAATFPLMGISTTLTSVMRSVREVRLPLLTTLTIFLMNIFGNWVLIYGNLGMPELQIQGAAISTLVCRVVETLFIGGYFLFFDKKVGYRLRDFVTKVSKTQMALYIKYSVPVIVSDLFLGLGNTAVSMVMGRIGSSFVAANAIIANVQRFSTIFNTGVSNSSGIITGNTLGEGDVEKAYRQGVTFLCLSVIMGLIAGVIILGVTPGVIGLFNITQETRQIAMQLMGAVALMVVFQTVEGVMTKGVLRAGGDTRFLMLADVLFLWVASVPLGALAAFVFHLPPFWIAIALKVDWLIKSIWCVFRLRGRKWIRRVSVA